MSEWDSLKSCVVQILSNNKDKYTRICLKMFTNSSLQHECPNVLMIFELLMVVPFKNAKVERMFTRMVRIKTDWRNRLEPDRLDAPLKIGEDGAEITNFDPSNAMTHWYNDKIRRLTAGPHSYPKSREINAKEK